jgi:branched-chain amino acid transport system permease protein
MPGILGRSTLLRNFLLAVIASGLLLLLTFNLSEFRNSQLAEIGYYACAVAGLTVLTGLSGQVSIGHGAFMFVGAYAAALILNHHAYNNKELVLVLLAALLITAAFCVPDQITPFSKSSELL